ncbi:MAG: YcxB family protein [Butyrivibrio sp.]|nr:YcxB family protein [Butyrivibrio sp.]
MEYKYVCDVKASDLWVLAMRRTYRSIVGVVNIVFTLAMILLTLRFFNGTGDLFKVLLIFGCILFPVIQPIATYTMCIKQLEDMPKDMELTFNDGGVHVQTGGKTQDIPWKKITNAIKQTNMIVVMSDDRHGYMLSNRTLGDSRDEFYDYLCSRIKA